jgi:uncharacterized protein
MVWSKYNYLFESEKFGFLLYNSLSNSFIELDEEAYSLLKDFEEGGNLDIEDTDFLEHLKKAKVVVTNDKDEFYSIKYATHCQRFYNKFLELTINPTLHCNFACKYCFENNKPAKYMSDEVEDALIDFIQNQKQIEKMHITWFGGEPLMAFDRVKSITKRIQASDISFTAGMITNGYLLSKKIISELQTLNINRLQITIDGLEQTHDQRRCLLSGLGTFNRIIQNIEVLKQTYPNYDLVIRMNVDKNNQDEFIKVYKYFHDKYQANIVVDPGFVDDINNCNASDCLFDRMKISQFLINLYKQYGLNIRGLYPQDNRYECAIRNPWHLVIGPEGEIYKCWNDVGNEKKIVSNLLKKEDGDRSLLTRYYVAADPFDNLECVNCFYLPICGGGCPYNRLANEFDDRNIDTCDIRKDNIKDFLELHYEFKKKTAKSV